VGVRDSAALPQIHRLHSGTCSVTKHLTNRWSQPRTVRMARFLAMNATCNSCGGSSWSR
jgi:hypothetical protein